MQSACAVLYCHLWPVWLYNIFPHYLINGTIFGKMLLNIKCVFWFYLQLLSETFVIVRRIQRDIIINVHRSSCKVPVILVRSYWNFKFLDRMSKYTQISNLMKIRPVGAELFPADGQTERHETRTRLIIRETEDNTLHPLKNQQLSTTTTPVCCITSRNLQARNHQRQHIFLEPALWQFPSCCTTVHLVL
jgi:hypothetical protein